MREAVRSVGLIERIGQQAEQACIGLARSSDGQRLRPGIERDGCDQIRR
jgi:hypothetical protein